MAQPHSSASKIDQDKRLQLLQRFDDIYKCTICLMNLDDPHLCPKCAKFYCYDCISEWLRSEAELHLYCPNCKCDLQLDKLVKARWFEEAKKLQRDFFETTTSTSSTEKSTTENVVDDGITNSNGDVVEKVIVCSKHLKDINFFCCTCNLCICHECIMADNQHMDHTFRTLNATYESKLQVAEADFEKVRTYKKKILPLVEEVERNVELVKKIREQKLQEIRSLAETAIEGLEQQINDMLQKLQGHKSALTDQIRDIEGSLELMEGEVVASNRLQFIAKATRISKECNKILTNPIKGFKDIRVPISLKIETPIIYETGVFVIENFSSLNENKRIYSDRFSDGFGRTWRIVLGRVVSKDRLELYLELVEGIPCWKECRFQLLHQDPSRIIDRKATPHKFTRNKDPTWGYTNFITLKKLVDDNYLRDDDSLELLYHIRQCSATSSDNDK